MRDGCDVEGSGDVLAFSRSVLCIEPGSVVDGHRDTEEIAHIYATLSTSGWVIAPADAIHRLTIDSHQG